MTITRPDPTPQAGSGITSARGDGKPHATATIADQWYAGATVLTEWTNTHLVNRRDVFGHYIAVENRKPDSDDTAITDKRKLTDALLMLHYRGGSTGDILGLHSTVRKENAGTGNPAVCLCRWIAIDIDRHDDDTDPEVTRKAALALYGRAADLGFRPLLLDSNGRGGYHLLLLFDAPIPTDVAHAFGKWLRRDWKELGLDADPEVFPKQPRIEKDGCGNWLRLPGRHHTRDHFTKVWDGSAWLEGTAAIGYIVATEGSSRDLIPAEALEDKQPIRKGRSSSSKDTDQDTEIKLILEALERLDPDDYHIWIRVGMCLQGSPKLGRTGLDLWDNWSTRSAKYKEGNCDRKWKSFNRSGGGLGIGTLFRDAEANGWPGQKVRLKELANGRPKEEASNGRHATPPPLKIADIKPDERTPPPDKHSILGPEEDWIDLDFQGKLDLTIDKVKAFVQSDGLEAFLNNKPILQWLAGYSKGERAPLKCWLKSKKGFSVRDFDERMKELKPKLPPGLEEPPLHSQSYKIIDGCHAMLASDGETSYWQQLANFSVRISEEITLDDGQDRSKVFRIVGKHAEGYSLNAEVPAEKFESLGWVPTQFGADALIEAGRGVKDHLRAAIQQAAPDDTIKSTIYTHTGWREIERDGKVARYYLHSGGAIGPDGLDPTVKVDLSVPGLTRFSLPAPPVGEDLVRAVRASMAISRLSQPDRPKSRATAALIRSIAYRAPLGETRFTVQFTGPTGSRKSCAIALAQQHYGAGLDFNNLPRQWKATEANLQHAQYTLKDALLSIDDWVGRGSRMEQERLNKLAADIFRSQGNGKGRDRCKSDGSPLPSKDPRCALISSGESRTSSASAEFRTLAVWFEGENPTRGAKGTIDLEVLTRCQRDASDGLYAASMAGYLCWLSSRLDEVQARFQGLVKDYRVGATRPGDHGRTPFIVADLAAANDIFLDFALSVGAVDEHQAAEDRKEVWAGLMDAADEMRADHEDTLTDGLRFVQLIRSALSNRDAYLAEAAKGVEEPVGIEGPCGWRKEQKNLGGGNYSEIWQAGVNADLIGWVSSDSREVYLDIDSAYAVVQKLVRDQNDSLPGRGSMSRLLHVDGLLSRIDEKPGRKTRLACRQTIAKRQKSVLVLRVDDVLGETEEVEPNQPESPEVETCV